MENIHIQELPTKPKGADEFFVTITDQNNNYIDRVMGPLDPETNSIWMTGKQKRYDKLSHALLDNTSWNEEEVVKFLQEKNMDSHIR